MNTTWKQNYSTFSKLKTNQKLSFVAGIFTLIFFIVLAISSILLQKTLREESQDIRQEAWSKPGYSGLASLAVNQSDGKTFVVGQPITLTVYFYAVDVSVDGIEVKSYLSGPSAIFSNINYTANYQFSDNALQTVVDQFSAGTQIPNTTYTNRFVAVTTDPTVGYRTPIGGGHGNNASIFTYTFTPQTTGTFTLNFDANNCFAINFADHSTDELRGPNQEERISYTYYVVDPDTTPTETLTPTPTETPANTPTATPTPDPNLSSCAAPTGVRLTSAPSCNSNGLVTFNVTWNAVEHATEYIIYAFNSANPANTIISYTTATNYQLTNVADGIWTFVVGVSNSETNGCKVDGLNRTVFDFSYDCQTQATCNYSNCSYSACQNGYRTNTCYLETGSSASCAATTTRTEACMTQCNYNCNDWGSCSATHLQTRTCTATNQSCWDYSGNNRGTSYEEVRYCDVAQTDDLLFDSYEGCWYTNSSGVSTYVAWNINNYPNATWVDISPYADFSSFAHKYVGNANTANGYGITDGTGFVWNHDNSTFTFAPATIYYARVLFTTDGTHYYHTRTIAFRMNQCAGTGGVYYQQCNQACGSGYNQCAPGLACHQGVCRLASDPNNTYCVDDGKRGCAQWCADNNECEAGLSCWYNYCRNPKNIDIRITNEQKISQELDKERQNNCADWNPQPKDYYYVYYTPANSTENKGGPGLNVASCNESCSSNAGCGMNMRCYQRQCRLAINPESESCDPYDKTGSKGGVGGTDETSEATSSKKTATISSTVSPTSASVTSKVTHAPIDTGDDTAEQADIKKETVLDLVKKFLAERGLSLMTLGIGAGVALLALILLFALASRKRDDDDDQPPFTSGGGFTSSSSSVMRPTSQSSPISPTRPASPTNQPSAAVRPTTVARPMPTTVYPYQRTSQTSQTAMPRASTASDLTPPPSSMLTKLQHKGVKPPQGA